MINPYYQVAIIDGEHESIKGYDLTPKGIIDFLELKTPIYSETNNMDTWDVTSNGGK